MGAVLGAVVGEGVLGGAVVAAAVMGAVVGEVVMVEAVEVALVEARGVGEAVVGGFAWRRGRATREG